MTGESFIDVDYCQRAKQCQVVSGDVFLSRKIQEEGRTLSVLSDGLGSGVKASVLANLTATMALRYATAFVDVRQSASTIMDTLPVCEVRKISYSTFTIVDVDEDGPVRLIEHGNPPLVVLRGNQPLPLSRTEITLEQWKDRLIHYIEFNACLGDRIIYFSDGVTQSGMGTPGLPLGWGSQKVEKFLCDQVSAQPEISAQELSRKLVAEAAQNDQGIVKDDITCGVVYFRRPRKLLIITGPPFDRERDEELAELVVNFDGQKAICGGTTANIVSRILNRPIHLRLSKLDIDVPPASEMSGVNLVTEGAVTLGKVAEMLEQGAHNHAWPDNPARELMHLMLGSDIVHFTVGTRINEAHQDPNVPIELDLRRNVIRKIAQLLETRYLKETKIQFL